jgi:hypothetical protein
MARGKLELTVVPMVYRVRHVPPRRKQAILSFVHEQTAVRLPTWDVDEAPAVGKLVNVGAVDWHEAAGEGVALGPRAVTTYRAARCPDGVVRLVAPVTSDAMNTDGEAVGLDRIARAPVFHHMSSRYPGYVREVLAAGPGLGNVVGSERQSAQAGTVALARTLVVIDGVLHAPCPPPGWAATRLHPLENGPDFAFEAKPDPMLRPGVGIRNFSPFGTDLRDRFGHECRPGRWPATWMGSVTEIVRGGFASDLPWHSLKEALSKVLWNGEDIADSLLEDESAARFSLMSAYRSWPVARQPGIVAAGVRLARAVHGIKPNGNVGVLDDMLKAAAELERAAPPMSLERRLEVAGIAIPDIGEGPAGPRPG